MRILLENWKIKLLCVMLASVLFAYVQYTRNVTQEIHVRVEEPELPGDLVFAEAPPSFMKVSIRGPREGVGFEATDLRIILTRPGDLEPGPNRFRATLTPKLPEGLKPIYDEEVTIQLGRAMEREMPVIPVFETPLPDDRQIGYLTIRPRTVRLRGPAGVLEEMKVVRAGPVAITDLSIGETSAYEGDINLDDQSLELLEADFQVRGEVSIVATTPPESGRIVREVEVQCSNEIPGLQMQVVGRGTVDVYLREENVPEGQTPTPPPALEAFVYCPVYYDEPRIVPSGRINDLPVEIRRRGSGEAAANVVRAEPAFVDLQFQQEEAPQVNPALREGLQEHQVPQ